jgi:hypothetical protein
MENCTVADNNIPPLNGNGIYCYPKNSSITLTNSIIYPDKIVGSALTSLYSFVPEGDLCIDNNICDDNNGPGYVDTTNNNYHLLNTSPCIDTGDPLSDYYCNEPAPNGLRINMGAYGGTASATSNPNAVSECYADIDKDGVVGIFDLSIMKSEFGRTNCSINPLCLADANNDGEVGLFDLVIMKEQFGMNCCPFSQSQQ